MELDILKPRLFVEDKIISGVTQRNTDKFPPYGFSIAPAKILSVEETMINRSILANHINLPFENGYCINLKFQKQVHADEIRIVDKFTKAFHYYEQTENDGMITNDNDVVLCVTIADCCAILIYDSVNHAIAALHSGWKGTMQNIAAKGIKLLSEKYSSRPEDLKVYLSPAASGKSYEVGYDVAKYFPDSTTKISKEKYLFDNRKQIRFQLIDLGVKEKNIEISDVCTISDLNYHSHRRDGDKAGRMCAFIGLK